MLRELCPHVVDGLLPAWVRNLRYRPVVLQRPDEPALMREAAEGLWLRGPDRDDLAADLTRRADALGGGLEVISFGEPAVADEGAGNAGEGEEVVGLAFV
ncbi:hypothetical protein ACFWM7_31850, partial [Streptomyces sp. NPDC058375]